MLARRFAKLSALLELADDEFIRLKNELVQYSNDIENNIEGIKINKITLEKFMKSNGIIKELNLYFEEWFDTPKRSDGKDFFIDDLPLQLDGVGISNINELNNLPKERKESIKETIDIIYIKEEDKASWSSSMILFSLVLIEAAINNSPKKAKEILDELKIGVGTTFIKKIKERIS